MVPNATDLKPSSPYTQVETSKTNLSGRQVAVHSRRCDRCCDDIGQLAWKVMLATLFLGTVAIAGGIGYGVKKHEWQGAAIMILSGGLLPLIGWLFFALVHPRGGCCCCYNGQCC